MQLIFFIGIAVGLALSLFLFVLAYFVSKVPNKLSQAKQRLFPTKARIIETENAVDAFLRKSKETNE